MIFLMKMKLNQVIVIQESNMAKKKKTKLNEIIFKSYQDAINNRMKAGHDVNLLVNRLNSLITKYS